MSGDPNIVQVVGRWAQLDTGQWVTPIPSFASFGYNEAAFESAIARFQHDPHGTLLRDGIAEHVRGRGQA